MVVVRKLHTHFPQRKTNVRCSGCLAHLAGQSLVQSQVKGVLFAAVPPCYPHRQIPSMKGRAGADSRTIERQVFTGGQQRDSANWIQGANSAFAEVGRGLICQ